MSQLKKAFMEADFPGNMFKSPGVAGICLFFNDDNILSVTAENVTRLYEDEKWSPDRSFTWEEFEDMAIKLGWTTSKDTEALNKGNDVDEESIALAELADRIYEREAEKCPTLLVEEVDKSMNMAEAAEILRFAEKVETMQLQSFIGMHWAEYMKGNPGDDLLPLTVKRAHWIREHYYPLCRKFFVSESLRTHTFLHRFQGSLFLPLISVGSIGDEKRRKEIVAVVNKMTPTALADADVRLWKKWAEIEKMVSLTRTSSEDIFHSFIEQPYFFYPS